MDDSRLKRRLESLAPPNLDDARERAKLAARVKMSRARVRDLSSTRPALARKARPGLFRTSHLAVMASLGVLALVGLIATPPGQAITSWIGDRVGLGQPGGHPSLKKLREHAFKSEKGGTAHVLIRGHGPAGPYEYITYLAHEGPKNKKRLVRCFEIDLPKRRALQGGSCGLPAGKMGLKLDAPGSAGGNVGPEAEVHFATGRVSEDVASVDVELDGRSVPVQLRTVPAVLTESLGLPRPFKVFVAFFAHAAQGGRLTVIARDEAGVLVARASRDLPDTMALRDERCQEVKRLAREGEIPRRFVRVNCRRAVSG